MSFLAAGAPCDDEAMTPRFVLALAVSVPVGFVACGLSTSGLEPETNGTSGSTTSSGTSSGTTSTSTTTTTAGPGGGGSTGSTSTTTTGGTGGAGGTGGGGTGGMGIEDCASGVDDDGDGAVDCEDDDCLAAGWQCVPEATDPAAKYVILAGAPCDQGYDPKAYQDCSQCDCGGTEGTCAGSYELFSAGTCSGVAAQSATINATGPDPTCFNNGNINDSGNAKVGVTATIALTQPGSCAPVEPPATDACIAGVVGRCGAGGVCAPPAQDPVECVLVSGACGGDYPNELVAFAHEACGCACAKTEACADAITVSTNDSCGSSTAKIAADGACHDSLLSTVHSIEVPAEILTCAPLSSPMGPAKTLCCL